MRVVWEKNLSRKLLIRYKLYVRIGQGRNASIFLHPPQTKFWEVYWFHPVCLSLRISHCQSESLPSVDMILSTHEIGNGCINFLKICTLITCYLKMCTWNFHIHWINFSSIYRFFSVFGLKLFFNSKKRSLQYNEEFWFKHWKCVVLELKLCIYYKYLQYFSDFC